MNCGQSIIAACDGTTWNFIKAADGTAYTDAQIKRQFELFVNKVVAMGTYFISYALAQGTSGMSVNMIKAMNALRCAFTAGFSNFWSLLAAAFFAARQFDLLLNSKPRSMSTTHTSALANR